MQISRKILVREGKGRSHEAQGLIKGNCLPLPAGEKPILIRLALLAFTIIFPKNFPSKILLLGSLISFIITFCAGDRELY